ncbi:MAG: hypothetical protein MUF21_02790 [Gemmatimonadaceae bacterium]|nr:hypothetical protein [Gemmatimonadaceae bacterium]
MGTGAVATMGRGPENELQAAIELAHDYRDALLRDADFTDIGRDECNDGWLRAFPRDSSAAAHEARADLVDKLEKLVLEFGTDQPLASVEGRDLLRVVVEWEAGGEMPVWDVLGGRARRQAIAPGLQGRVRNPVSGRCEATGARDTTLFILPAVPSFQRTPRAGVALRLVFGEGGLKEARDAFWRGHPLPETDALFAYTRIAATLLWKEYAVVTVHRPLEQRGAVALPTSNGGGTYIFHRAGGEWRLLAIARTWG